MTSALAAILGGAEGLAEGPQPAVVMAVVMTDIINVHGTFIWQFRLRGRR